MGDTEEPRRKFVVFLDSLGPSDVGLTEWIDDNAYDGTFDAGVPYVTPKVLGEIYTGESPATHGLPAVSRHGQDARLRPAVKTLPEITAESDAHERVCCFGWPFIAPPDVDESGVYWHSSSAMGESATYPPGAEKHMTVTGPAGDLSNPDEDGDVLFNLRMDYTRQYFGTARSLAEAQDFDVMFLSYRLLDSYCHYRYDRAPEDGDLTDRELLLKEIVDRELEDLRRHGDVFVFGDHGATAMDDVFRINRWLMRNGYLDVEIDTEFRDQAIERGLASEADGPGTVIRPDSPFVTINEEESVAISSDPFSTGLTVLDGSSHTRVAELIGKLRDHPAIVDVHPADEMWDGPLIDEAPDLYPEREVGWFVSGNLAEEMGGPELTRSGVHDRTAAWGCTEEIETEVDEPTDLFDAILEFVGVEADQGGQSTGDAAGGRDVRGHLQDMGYL